MNLREKWEGVTQPAYSTPTPWLPRDSLAAMALTLERHQEPLVYKPAAPPWEGEQRSLQPTWVSAAVLRVYGPQLQVTTWGPRPGNTF